MMKQRFTWALIVIATFMFMTSVAAKSGLFARVQQSSAPRWPSLEQQLEADDVVPGSELEKLIRANQDFSMLRPEEAKDRLPYPLWLRVYWRKQHRKASIWQATRPAVTRVRSVPSTTI